MHWQTFVFLMFSLYINFVLKFAVHYTKLLRKNGQWGGERGGYLMIYDTVFGVYTLLGKAQADYYY